MTTNYRLARLGDATSGYCDVDERIMAGTIVSASPDVKINGIFAARVGDTVQCSNGHTGVISDGRTTVKINGQLAAKIGSNFTGTYHGTVTQASPNVG